MLGVFFLPFQGGRDTVSREENVASLKKGKTTRVKKPVEPKKPLRNGKYHVLPFFRPFRSSFVANSYSNSQATFGVLISALCLGGFRGSVQCVFFKAFIPLLARVLLAFFRQKVLLNWFKMVSLYLIYSAYKFILYDTNDFISQKNTLNIEFMHIFMFYLAIICNLISHSIPMCSFYFPCYTFIFSSQNTRRCLGPSGSSSASWWICYGIVLRTGTSPWPGRRYTSICQGEQ